jgi:hypothetical protein
MAAALLMIGKVYLLAGLAVAAAFLSVGVQRIDERAAGAWVFRVLLVPGILLVWPLVLWRWRVLARGEDFMARHRLPRGSQNVSALVMVVLIPVIVLGALLIRQDGPVERRAVLLEAPE